MNTIVTEIKALPDSLQSALRSLGYKSKDINVIIQDTCSLSDAGGSGRKGFSCLVNLQTGEHETLRGSWGGANMFNPNNRVDTDTQSRILGENLAVIKGSIGEYTFAQIYIGNKNVVPNLLTEEKLDLNSRQVLYCYRLKSAYRKDELDRLNKTNAVIQITNDLIKNGYLKKDGRGMSLTTKGKNQIADCYGMMPSK